MTTQAQQVSFNSAEGGRRAFSGASAWRSDGMKHRRKKIRKKKENLQKQMRLIQAHVQFSAPQMHIR
jgi:hypothetical protein